MIMDDANLNVTEGYVNDCKITYVQYQPFVLFSLSALGKNDEIGIPI